VYILGKMYKACISLKRFPIGEARKASRYNTPRSLPIEIRQKRFHSFVDITGKGYSFV
jgi:hypothetical protein